MTNKNVTFSMLLMASLFLGLGITACGKDGDSEDTTVTRTGKPGEDGTDGTNGRDGKDCMVVQLQNGVLIECGGGIANGGTSAVVVNGLNGSNGVDGQNGTNGTNGTDGQDGADGQNAPPTAYTVVGVVDPCGKQASFDEVLLKLQNGQLMAHYSDGARQFLTLIGPGNYITTDNTSCHFSVSASMEVTW